jgi:hypothetical protein
MYKSPGNYNWKTDSFPEYPSGKTRTVPDQNYTMREILNKFTTGQPINGMGTYLDFDTDGTYEPDFNDYQPHPMTLDLVERAEMAREAQKEIDQIHFRKLQKQRQDEEDLKLKQLSSPAGEEK